MNRSLLSNFIDKLNSLNSSHTAELYALVATHINPVFPSVPVYVIAGFNLPMRVGQNPFKGCMLPMPGIN